MLNSLFNTQQPKQSTPLSGVAFNRPTGFTDQYGGNGELTGVSNWGSYFTGLDKLGEGFAVEDVQAIGGANPTGFRINRADPNGNANVYQQRNLSINPDGSLGWADGSDWKSHTQQSQMSHFLNAGLPMALAMAGGMGAFGNLGAAGLGTGTGATAASGATNAALIDSALGTAGYGASSAGAGGAAAVSGGLGSIFNGGLPKMSTGNSFVDKLLGNVTSNLFGGGNGGISNMGNLASLFSNYKQYDQNKDLINEIKGIYSPDGAYAKALENKLARRDAAAGRNSQYGPRLAELMGTLGDSQARALSGLGGFMGQQQGGLNGMLGAGQRLLGGFNLGDLFQGGMGGGLSNNWDLGPNAGPQLPEGVSDISDLLDWFN